MRPLSTVGLLVVASIIGVVAGSGCSTGPTEPVPSAGVERRFERQGFVMHPIDPEALNPATDEAGPRFSRVLRRAQLALTNTAHEGPATRAEYETGWVTVVVFPNNAESERYEQTLEWYQRSVRNEPELADLYIYRERNVIVTYARFRVLPTDPTTPTEGADLRPRIEAALDAL
jgi:hypothetical protein